MGIKMNIEKTIQKIIHLIENFLDEPMLSEKSFEFKKEIILTNGEFTKLIDNIEMHFYNNIITVIPRLDRVEILFGEHLDTIFGEYEMKSTINLYFEKRTDKIILKSIKMFKSLNKIF